MRATIPPKGFVVSNCSLARKERKKETEKMKGKEVSEIEVQQSSRAEQSGANQVLALSKTLLLFISLSFHKSVSTLSSLKWQGVCTLWGEGMQQTELLPIGLGRFKGNFTTSWRHGYSSFEAFVSII